LNMLQSIMDASSHAMFTLDRDGMIDADDTDCIFRHDAAALRAAAKMLRGLEGRT